MGMCAWLAALAVLVPMSIGPSSSRNVVPSQSLTPLFSFLSHADCRYTCHQECRSLIQLDCPWPDPCQGQLSPESTLLPPCSQVRRGGAVQGGTLIASSSET